MRLGFVFPGQGSQSVGMHRSFAAEPVVRQTYAEASAVLAEDLWALAQEGPAERQAETERTQPLVLTADVAAFRLWRARGGRAPHLLAGHSLGEFSALVCAGALGFTDAVSLVRERARLMQAAVPPGTGAMAAILGLEDAEVEAACAEARQREVVEAVNYNAPGQLVIAGQARAVERAILACKARGAKRAVPLAVSVPAHSSLLREAALRFGEVIDRVAIGAPDVSVFGIGATPHTTPDSIRTRLVEQLFRPVRWTATVAAMVEGGARALVECGPGRVLTTLNRRIVGDKAFGCYATDDEAALAAALAALGPPSGEPS